jgi:DNA-directed RNA polymerase subunit RPC12/RpoP
MTTCPKCGSRFLRPSAPRTTGEWLGKLRFIDPLRCLDCKTRFVAHTVVWSDLHYTRCPICHRMDLNGWTGKTYQPPFWMAVKIAFGAGRYRCEYCRINFASFRRRKEVFTFSRWKKLTEQQERERQEREPEGRRSEGAAPEAGEKTETGQKNAQGSRHD